MTDTSTQERAFITGGAGFIGSHLAEHLLRMGSMVTAYDNFDDYYGSKELNIDFAGKDPNYKFVKGDILDQDNVNESFKDSEILYHLAAQPGVRFSIENPHKTFRVNFQGTLNVLEGARRLDIKKIVFASSSSVYGDPKSLPVREDSKLEPISPYGLSKFFGEKACLQYSQIYGLRVVILRYHTVYGPRQRPDMAFRKWILSLLHKKPPVIYGDGNQTRDFTYIDDIIEGTVRAALIKEAEGEVFNLGSCRSTNVNTIVSILQELMDSKNIQPAYEEKKIGDVQDTLADVSKAKAIIGYKADTSLKVGLKNEVDWCLKHLQV
ncbi:MAG: NAD-dependent epimerase/dehydratase family protein [Nitrososphaerales archaeon]